MDIVLTRKGREISISSLARLERRTTLYILIRLLSSSDDNLFLGKSSSKPLERKNDKQENSNEMATKELAENVANHRSEDETESKEKSHDSSLPKSEGNNNEIDNVDGACGDNPSTESNDLNTVGESKGEGGEETFTESEPNAVAICGS